MPVDQALDAHVATVKMDIHEVARQLISHLGPTLVATLANVKDRKAPGRWATVGGQEPKPEQRKNLLTAHRIWTSISNAESDGVARSWFIGANPRLNEESPVFAIREGLHKEVLAAALAFVEGTDD